MPFKFDSPALQPAPGAKDKGLSILYECPTGYTLRESPWVYNVIAATNHDENLSPADADRMSAYYHAAAQLVHAERARLRERRDRRRAGSNDAAYGAKVRAGRA